MLGASLLGHAVLFAAVLLVPAALDGRAARRARIGHDRQPRPVRGPADGGRHRRGRPAVQEIAPPTTAPEPVRPPAPRAPEMVEPEPKAPPKKTPPPTGRSRRRGADRAHDAVDGRSRCSKGEAVAERRAARASAGLSSGAGGTGVRARRRQLLLPAVPGDDAEPHPAATGRASQQSLGDHRAEVRHPTRRHASTDVEVERRAATPTLDLIATAPCASPRQLPPLPARVSPTRR